MKVVDRNDLGPPQSPLPPAVDVWPDLYPVRAPDARVLAVIVTAAVGVDLAMRSRVDGLAGALLGAVVAGGLLGSARIENRRAWPLLLLVPLCTAWLGIRAAEWLLVLDVLAACGLVVIGASFARDGDPLDLTIPGVAGRTVHAGLHAMVSGGFLVAAFRALDRREAPGATAPGRAAAVLRGLLLGAPVVGIIGLLLASADAVFASFFRVPVPTDLLGHVVLLAVGGWGAAALLRLASGASYALPRSRRTLLGEVEAVTVLAALAALFTAFAASQVAVAVGGADYVRRTVGLSYAEHARSGFFQLLAVAALTLGLLLALRGAVHITSRRFVVLAEVAVALTLVVVGGAVRRLSLYEQAYGLTVLRLCAVLFACWVGVVFILLGLSLAGLGGPRRWVVPGAAAAGVVMLLGLGVANPEALVVRRNVAHFAGTDRFDVAYLTTLSDDAVPALVGALPILPPEQAAAVEAAICAGPRRTTGGLWSYNASRDRAAALRQRVCPGVAV